MFEATKAAINCLSLKELLQARDALTLLSSMNIDNDRQQTLLYVNKLIAHIQERNIVTHGH